MPRPCPRAPRSWPAAGGSPTMPGRPGLDRRGDRGRLRVGLGDTLTFSVLGRNLEAGSPASGARSTGAAGGSISCSSSIRAPLPAPRTPSWPRSTCPSRETVLLDRLATRLPNVTPITLREVVGRATEVLGRVELAVDIVAGLTLGGGILALAGGILAARSASATRPWCSRCWARAAACCCAPS